MTAALQTFAMFAVVFAAASLFFCMGWSARGLKGYEKGYRDGIKRAQINQLMRAQINQITEEEPCQQPPKKPM